MQASDVPMQCYPLATELNSGFLRIMIRLFTWMKESGEYGRLKKNMEMKNIQSKWGERDRQQGSQKKLS